VSNGTEFGLYVSAGAKDLEGLKKEFLDNKSLKNKRILEDLTNVLHYEFLISGFDVMV
jgi:hypothetical protein